MKSSGKNLKIQSNAFKSVSFRRYTYGNLVSWIGDWMDLTVLNWAVLALSGSPSALGLVNACRLLPVFALSVPAGIIADRFDRRQTIFTLQLLMMGMTVLLGYAFGRHAPIGAIALLVTLRASVSAILVPLRSVYSANLVDEDSIRSAAAIHATSLNLSRIIGPALGGFLLTVLDAEQIFYLNASSFVFVILTLSGLKEVSRQVRPAKQGGLLLFKEALAYIKGSTLVRSLMLLSIVPMVFGFPYSTLMPLIVQDIIHGGPFELGLLLSAAATGAIGGSVVLSLSPGKMALGKKLVGSIALFGLFLAMVPLGGHFYTIMALLGGVGFFSQIYRTTNRAAFLVSVPDEMRGRMMSIVMMDRGFIPLGTVLITGLIEQSSTLVGMVVMGLACSFCALMAVVMNPSLLKMD